MAVLKPELIFKSIVPIIMAGILGIYGLIVCIIIFQSLNDIANYTEAKGYRHLAAGLCCGFSSLVSDNADKRLPDWLLESLETLE